LIPGEDARDYQRLLTAVTNLIKPVDVLVAMWVRDIVDLQWDITRFRRIKANVITYFYEEERARSEEEGSEEEGSEEEGSEEEGSEEEGSEEEGRSAFASRAEELNDDIAAVVSRPVVMDDLERIDRMVMTMEARRNAAYREAERYRIGLGERLRRAAEQVEDAELREVDDAPSEHEGAA
jgi:hypothetical protein